MKDNFYEKKSEIIKSLSNPIRLMIVDALLDGEKSVSQIMQITNQSQSNISKSLAILKSNGILQDKKEGLNVFYSLKICCMGEFFSCLNKILKECLEHE